jgi:hypothetical protein
MVHAKDIPFLHANFRVIIQFILNFALFGCSPLWWCARLFFVCLFARATVLLLLGSLVLWFFGSLVLWFFGSLVRSILLSSWFCAIWLMSYSWRCFTRSVVPQPRHCNAGFDHPTKKTNK